MPPNPHGLRYVDSDTFHELVASKAALDDVAVVKYCLNEELDLKEAAGTRKITFAISTDGIDRDRDTIAVNGWKLASYKKNPVVLWAHDYRQPPIGKSADTKPDGSKLLSTAEFFPPEVSTFADSIFQMIKFGGLRAASVGFRPLKHEFNETRRGVDILEAELLEWSVVPIPANPSALVQLAPKSCLKAIETWCEQYLDESYGGKGIWVPRFQVEETFKLLTDLRPKITVALESQPAAPQEAKTVLEDTSEVMTLEVLDAEVLELADEELLFVDHEQITAAVGRAVRDGFAAVISTQVRERLDYARGRVS